MSDYGGWLIQMEDGRRYSETLDPGETVEEAVFEHAERLVTLLVEMGHHNEARQIAEVLNTIFP